ncbi:MAG: ATP-dependent Clp protease ATP-binding subunit ClpX, partial [Saprospiraceae bacterium]|nr:ATP-dependent Clp protease ATP-binding subunit ClpX [Saprospiraceae bacterium]
MAKKNKDNEQTCSFCGKERKDVSVLVQGEDIAICDNCVEQAFHIVQEEVGTNKKKNSKRKFKLSSGITPIKIKEFLDLYVVGQD